MKARRKNIKGKARPINWFGIRILFESLHPEERRVPPLFEERIIVCRARSASEARKKAAMFGRASKQDYKNMYGKKVVWLFKEVLGVAELFDRTIREGSEVYYRFLDSKDLKHLRRLA